MSQQFTEDSGVRTYRLTGVGRSVPPSAVPKAFTQQRPRPSALRTDEERERRHRERTISTWLRSLSR